MEDFIVVTFFLRFLCGYVYEGGTTKLEFVVQANGILAIAMELAFVDNDKFLIVVSPSNMRLF